MATMPYTMANASTVVPVAANVTPGILENVPGGGRSSDDLAATPTYYALHVTPGHERAMARRVARLAGDALADVFQLKAEYQRRRAQVWRAEREVLYPGYLFLQIGDLDAFERSLSLATEYHRLLSVGGNAAPLTREEADFVYRVGGPEHMVAMSTATLVGERLHVFAGPLVGCEHTVRGYNRRKRLAWLSTGFNAARPVSTLAAARPTTATAPTTPAHTPTQGLTKVGLDIVSKT